MREILFKAKRLDNGEWVEGLPIRSHIGFSSRIDTIQYAFGGYLPTHKIDPETLCEYTGLKDKGGNKIFENDIVKLNYIEVRDFNGVKYDFKTEFIEEVVFYNGAFQYHLKAEEIDFYRHIVNLPLDKVKVESVEVLGNIFDNPELLGE